MQEFISAFWIAAFDSTVLVLIVLLRLAWAESHDRSGDLEIKRRQWGKFLDDYFG